MLRYIFQLRRTSTPNFIGQTQEVDVPQPLLEPLRRSQPAKLARLTTSSLLVALIIDLTKPAGRTPVPVVKVDMLVDVLRKTEQTPSFHLAAALDSPVS
jgi:hypothetical protein